MSALGLLAKHPKYRETVLLAVFDRRDSPVHYL